MADKATENTLRQIIWYIQTGLQGMSARNDKVLHVGVVARAYTDGLLGLIHGLWEMAKTLSGESPDLAKLIPPTMDQAMDNLFQGYKYVLVED